MLLYYSLWVLVCGGTAVALRRLEFDAKTIAIIIGGLLLCYFYLYTTTQHAFMVDLPLHAAYIQFVAANNALPGTGDGVSAAYHMPFYYIVAAQFYKLAPAGLEPLMMSRHVSTLCFAIYFVLIALTFRRLLQYKQPAYYLALAVMVCWPIGVTLSARIHPDPFTYIGQMGIIYSLLCFTQDKKSEALANAFFFCGVLLLARNFGTFFVGFTTAYFLYALYQNRQAIAQIVTRRMILSIAFVVGCYVLLQLHDNDIINAHRQTIIRGDLFGDGMLRVFTYFNPLTFMMQTSILPDETIEYWPYFLRTAVLGGFITWESEPLVFAISGLWLMIIAYTIIGLFLCRRSFSQAHKHVLWTIFLLGGLMIGLSLGARFVFVEQVQIGDARYVLPGIAMVIGCFGLVIQQCQIMGRASVARIGNGLGLGFILLSIALLLAQYLLY